MSMVGRIPFVGRQEELSSLLRLQEKKAASLVVIKGRRRIGKSRLAREFAGHFDRSVILTGLPPERDVSAQDQRQDFAQQLADELGIDRPAAEDWGHLLRILAGQFKRGSALVVLDEITWLGSKDPTFLGKLKTVWDTHFCRNPRLVLLLSGSMSLWLEDNLLKSTGFTGRISLELDLKPLPLAACPAFWGQQADRVSAHEMLRLLAVTGCIPRYLEEIAPGRSAEENIRTICFAASGFLFREFDRLFSDFFGERRDLYGRLIRCLGDGPLTAQQACEKLGVVTNSKTLRHLEGLVSCGFVTRDYTWNIPSGRESKRSRYRLSDNYLRFYIKYIEPNRRRIARGGFSGPGPWPTVAGLQFENLLLQCRDRLLSAIGVSPEEIVYDNPFFRPATQRAPGVQIDYMVQTRFNTLYVCEAKFLQEPVGSEVIKEVSQRLTRLKPSRGFSVRPILIHVNGVTPSVIESEFFANIVDFSAFLTS